MLDDHERVAGVAQFREHFEQLVDVREMQPGRRLVEDIDRAPGRLFRQLRGELDPLRLAAAEGRAVLSEPHVAEAHVFERHELVVDLRHVAEKARGFVHGQVEDVGDVLALVGDLQRLAVVAPAAADFALHIDVGEKVHLDLFHAVALAGLAAPAFHVEGKAPDLVAADARGGQAGKEFADRSKRAGVGHGIRARRAPDGRLVDDDRFVDLLEAVERGVFAGAVFGAVEMAEQRAPQDVIDERGFPAAGDAGHACEAAERKGRGHTLEVVFPRAGDGQPAGVVLVLEVLRRDELRAVPLLRHGDFRASAEILGGQRILHREHLGQRALGHEVAAARARAGAEVEDVVGAADGVLVVLDDDDGISQIPQPPQRADEPVVVALMQPDARLIEHVKTARQPAADLRGQPDALRFAAAQRPAFAIQREVAEPDLHEKTQPRCDLPAHLAGDEPLLLIESQRLHETQRVGDREAAELVDVERRQITLDRDGQNLRFQPRARARRTRPAAHVLADALARKLAVGRLVKVLERGHEPVERLLHLLALAIFTPGKGERPLARAVAEGLVKRGRELAIRGVHRNPVFLRERGEDALVITLHALVRLRPRRDRASGERFLTVGDHEIRVADQLRAEAVAVRARAKVRVEGKVLRRQRGQGEAGVRIAEIGGVAVREPLLRFHAFHPLQYRYFTAPPL